MSKYAVHICGPCEVPANVKRMSVVQLHARMRRCARKIEKTRGTVMNLTWLHWMGEWMLAHDELKRRRPDAPAEGK